LLTGSGSIGKDGNGRKQGRWCTFYERGNLKSEVTFRDDKKNGYLKEYAENGDLLKISKYIEDVLQPEAEEIQKLEVRMNIIPMENQDQRHVQNGIPEGSNGNTQQMAMLKKLTLQKWDNHRRRDCKR